MLQYYSPSLTAYRRLQTREVSIGSLSLGANHPIRIQTMTTTDTMDTAATVAQTIRCIEAGAELVRITAPSKREAENLALIKKALNVQRYHTPLVADIHFTPNAAEIAARIVEKVRINPGNYIDKKKFDFIEYTDQSYLAELERIRERFLPLIRICKEYGTAMRIGTNHGSLSDRIMSRYGDTAMGMVESAMEFLRIARDENYHQIVLSMKSSNPLVMVQAYRLLVQTMDQEFGDCYPLHLGVTEAGDGEDGRVKSAIGIGALLEDGIGDTIRVSLTEDPEFEIPVCRDLVRRYAEREHHHPIPPLEIYEQHSALPYSPFQYSRRTTKNVDNIGGSNPPVVVADYSQWPNLTPEDLAGCGYHYDAALDKWRMQDAAADYIYIGQALPKFPLPGALQPIMDAEVWTGLAEQTSALPIFHAIDYLNHPETIEGRHFVWFSVEQDWDAMTMVTERLATTSQAILVARSDNKHRMPALRRLLIALCERKLHSPVLIHIASEATTADDLLIEFATDAGALLLDGFGDGIWLRCQPKLVVNLQTAGRTYLEVQDVRQFLNNTAFSILQAARTRISKTEYISCPSCGRTLFDLQETTAKIRAATHHLKGVKIAIMGCIVNGPGEMADADFGYVGSGPGKITLYVGKEIVKRNIPSEVAVTELINLLKDYQAWTEPEKA